MSTTLAPPRVACEQVHPGIRVPDVRAAIDHYVEKLGFSLGFTSGDPPDFAGLNFGNVQIFLEEGPARPEACSVYFVVEDVDALHGFHRERGVTINEPLRDQEYGMRDYAIRDPHGHRLAFGQHLFNAGPKIVVERVDVPVRLEKRLAALLADLAQAKRMSIGECLEEMILHTNEGVGPHTRTHLELIQRLKLKHGIDYDSHASYRFAER